MVGLAHFSYQNDFDYKLSNTLEFCAFLPSAVRCNELVHETKTDSKNSEIFKISAIVVFLLKMILRGMVRKKVSEHY